MKYKINEENTVYNGFLKVKKAKLTHDRFDKKEVITCTREMLDRGDCVGVLLYEKDTNNIIMVNQFRYPILENNTGWLLEIVAGGVENMENPITSARREIEEETGYVCQELEHISTFYTTPGNSSERMFLYYAEVLEKDKLNIGGGVQGENEDIQICKFHVSELEELLSSQTICDGKSIIALQWFKINKPDK